MKSLIPLKYLNRMVRILLTFTSVFIVLSLSAQSYIGKSKDQITSLVPKEMPGFAVNTFGKNPDVNSMKFYDSKKDRSLIFFFDSKNVCTYYKLVEDIGVYAARVTEFNSAFQSSGTDKWTATANGKSVKVSIEKSDYILTVLYSL